MIPFCRSARNWGLCVVLLCVCFARRRFAIEVPFLSFVDAVCASQRVPYSVDLRVRVSAASGSVCQRRPYAETASERFARAREVADSCAKIRPNRKEAKMRPFRREPALCDPDAHMHSLYVCASGI